mgnify:CR=1 FL=1
MFKKVFSTLLVTTACVASGVSVAQTAANYPNKQIKLVVSFTAGGTTDILAREVAQQMTVRWKVPVIVENKPGASGKWWADLPGLARQRLAALGGSGVYGNDGSAPWCTVGNASRFFSHRRDRISGRQAACIWLD